MANLPESVNYDAGVYQLELTDPVVGGVDGKSNASARNLANRTAWLKAQIDAMATIVPQAEAEAGAATTLRGWTAQRVRQAIDVAITALVNASPGALDTLSELATALANDPNFATTITNALALKAPLASPAFTGNPTGPTPAQFDNDTSLATTEFIRKLGPVFSAMTLISASVTLTAAQTGSWFQIITTPGLTATLPDIAATSANTTFTFVATVPFILKAAGANQIFNIYNVNANQISIPAGATAILVSNGVAWYIVSLSYEFGSYGVSLAANGYQKLPSGLIVQWGTFTTNASGMTNLTFPLAFPTGLLSFTATPINTNNANLSTQSGTPTASVVPVGCLNSANVFASVGVRWLAVGN